MITQKFSLKRENKNENIKGESGKVFFCMSCYVYDYDENWVHVSLIKWNSSILFLLFDCFSGTLLDFTGSLQYGADNLNSYA